MPGTSVCSPLWYLWHYDLLVFQEEGREGKREGGKKGGRVPAKFTSVSRTQHV